MQNIPFILFAIALIISCENPGNKDNSNQESSGESAYFLAKNYCGSCHQYPEPQSLDKLSWENAVLPRMGNMLGIYASAEERASLIETPGVEKIFPPEPIIEPADWKKIQEYYLSNAPNALEVPKPEITTELKDFEILTPEYIVSPPSSTLVKFMDDRTIFIGDAISKKLIQFSEDLEFIKAGNILEGAVHIEETEDEYWILSMGSFSPTDRETGMLINMSRKENNRAMIIADQLRRPVHASYGDLNNDGKQDIVICEFAKWTGRLIVLYNQGNKQFSQKTLVAQTGATKTYLQDFDDDGLLDIIALFAQGNEGISIFYNQGDGNFLRDEVLSFSPCMGSSSFEIIDLEKDGDMDILYTAGDNADFKPILKPYHGIYIFENDGNNNFKQLFFHHLNGAYGAKMEDYDLDGDLDIAAISFFPDYADGAKESFLYLKNNGDWNFTPFTFENNSRGRWIVMDAKDKDADGDIDLILGSLVFETIPDNGQVKQWIDNGLPFVILENQTKH